VTPAADGIKTLSKISYYDLKAIGITQQLDFNACTAGMFTSIANRFLDDTKDVVGLSIGYLSWRPGGPKTGGSAVSPAVFADQSAQRLFEPHAGRRRGMLFQGDLPYVARKRERLTLQRLTQPG